MSPQAPAIQNGPPPGHPAAMGPPINDITAAPAAPAPDRVGQGTAIEQSRAVAEVQGSIVLARQYPRDSAAAIKNMRESCAQPRLAERAFFRFKRGGANVSGASVHVARDLARCWGNVVYGVKELRRDDEYSQSEMLAYAWDLETNARAETMFIVPHKRDKKGGPQKLVDMRDIYENNANNGARRLRECIFAMLPPWFVEEAKEILTSTLENGGGKSLDQRIADCISLYGEFGITSLDLEAKIGREHGRWTAQDIAALGVIIKSIHRGEVSKEDEFPNAGNPVTAAAINAQAEGGNGVKAPEVPPVDSQAENSDPVAPPAPPPEPPEQAAAWPPQIPVPAGENGADWKIFATNFVNVLNTTKTVDEMNSLWSAHDGPLNNLQTAAAKEYSRIKSAYQTRQIQLANPLSA